MKKILDILHGWLLGYMGRAGLILYGGSTSSPDYQGAALQQGQQSRELANQQTASNRPNQTTPWGSSSWTSSLGTDPATGKPITNWSQNVSLDPTLQGSLTQQMGLQANKANLANSMMPKVAESLSKPFDWSALPAAPTAATVQNTSGTNVQGSIVTPGQNTAMPTQTTQTTNEPAFAAQRDAIANAMFSRMMPLQQLETQTAQGRLANMGMPMGSEAYNREMGRMGMQHSASQYDALMNAGQEQARMQQALLAQQQQAWGQQSGGMKQQNEALQNVYGQNLGAGNFANAASGQVFGQNLKSNEQNFAQQQAAAAQQEQLRQNAISEQMQARQMSLNEMNALLAGAQINQPTMPGIGAAGSATAAPLLNAATAQGNQWASQQPDWGTLLGAGLRAAA